MQDQQHIIGRTPGIALARKAVASGAAKAKLEQFVAFTQKCK